MKIMREKEYKKLKRDLFLANDELRLYFNLANELKNDILKLNPDDRDSIIKLQEKMKWIVEL